MVALTCLLIPGLQGNASHYQFKYNVFFSCFLSPVCARAVVYEGTWYGFGGCELSWLLKPCKIAVVNTILV